MRDRVRERHHGRGLRQQPLRPEDQEKGDGRSGQNPARDWQFHYRREPLQRLPRSEEKRDDKRDK